MTSAGLVAIAFLLSSIFVCAQERNTAYPPTKGAVASQPVPKDFERSKIAPGVLANSFVPQDALTRLQRRQAAAIESEKQAFLTSSDQNPGPNADSKTQVLNALRQIPGDNTCLKIRSYQVARDSKDSDSTHLVGYSTCLPASLYQLRTTVGTENPVAPTK
jgi:hypothetical protein